MNFPFQISLRTVVISVITFLVFVSGFVFLHDALVSADAFKGFAPQLFLAAMAAHAATLGLNSVRLSHSLSLHGDVRRFPSLRQMTDAMVLHNFLVSFLPARMADGYYPFLIARRAQVSVGAGLGNLLVIRIFDVMAISVILAALAPLAYAGAELERFYRVVIPLVLALIVAAARIDLLLGIALALFQSTLHRFALGRKVSRTINQARHWTSQLTTRQRIELGLISLVPWLASGFTYLFAIEAVGIDIGWAEAILAGKLAEIGAALPIQAAGGIGAGEGMMAAMLVGLGLPLAAAGLAALGVRFLILGVVAGIFAIRSLVVLTFAERDGTSILGRIFGPDRI
ncbi:MAG: lysylphosphatidylglycerol synthase domain-containing protein [Rhodospirillales bacterium]